MAKVALAYACVCGYGANAYVRVVVVTRNVGEGLHYVLALVAFLELKGG